MEVKILDFSVISDDRGSLVALEQHKNIPFDIKRVYYIYNTSKDVRRGFHAHKELQQVLIAVNGSCRVLLDDGKESVEVELNSPAKGLFVDKLVWREMYDFSDDLVLMVLASDYYNEGDYIRDYDEFIEIVSDLKFVEYDEIFLELSTKWLSDPEIKRLTMTPEIDRTKQLEWFSSLKNRNDYYIRGILYSNNPIGAFGIKNISRDCAEYWGYIGEKEYWSKGIGKYMLNYIFRYAKKSGLSYLYLKVHKDNYRAIALYKKYGFTELFQIDEVIYMVYKL
jgi:RimJ/RimL family protein N-acetyltransferase